MKNEIGAKRVKQVCSANSHKNLHRCIDFFLEQIQRDGKKMKEQQEELWRMQNNVHVYKILRYPPDIKQEKILYT